jgi:hypothetical protein
MNYTDIISLLKEVFTDICPDGTFVSGRRPDATLLSNDATYPLCVVTPIRQTVDYNTGNTSNEITMFFLYKDDVNNTLAQKDTIVSTAEALLNNFRFTLDSFLQEPSSEYYGKGFVVDPIIRTPERDILTVVSGFSCRFTLRTHIDQCVPVPKGLVMDFYDLANIPTMGSEGWNYQVQDYNDINEWNTFFGLPTNGAPFTDVEVDTVHQRITLFGNGPLVLKSFLFYLNYNIKYLFDYGRRVIACNERTFGPSSIILFKSATNRYFGDGIFLNATNLEECISPNLLEGGSALFYGCNKLEAIEYPRLKYWTGTQALQGASSIKSIKLHSLEQFGDTTGNDSFFVGISGNNILLEIPAALMTCDDGDPDGDIQLLQANNNVTIKTL